MDLQTLLEKIKEKVVFLGRSDTRNVKSWAIEFLHLFPREQVSSECMSLALSGNEDESEELRRVYNELRRYAGVEPGNGQTKGNYVDHNIPKFSKSSHQKKRFK